MKLLYTKKQAMKLGELSYKKGVADATKTFEDFIKSDQFKAIIKNTIKEGFERFDRQTQVEAMVLNDLLSKGYFQTEEGAFILKEDED